jgi:hypothetical protein
VQLGQVGSSREVVAAGGGPHGKLGGTAIAVPAQQACGQWKASGRWEPGERRRRGVGRRGTACPARHSAPSVAPHRMPNSCRVPRKAGRSMLICGGGDCKWWQ